MNVSVVVITRNRAGVLAACLRSLTAQTIPPSEILIIDNGPSDETRAVFRQFRGILPLRYVTEKKTGIPFARNTGIAKARGQIIAFIDDDCVADPSWTESIMRHFRKTPGSAGVIGINGNADKDLVSAVVEQAYILRWMMAAVGETEKKQRLRTGFVIDFKNAAFRSDFIKKYRFSSRVPYGDVGDEDVELGWRLWNTGRPLHYDPAIRISHHNSPSVRRMLRRNFWLGFSNRMLLQTSGLDLRSVSRNYPLNRWLWTCAVLAGPLKAPGKKLQFYVLLVLFPLWSKAGRVYAATRLATGRSATRGIPQRT